MDHELYIMRVVEFDGRSIKLDSEICRSSRLAVVLKNIGHRGISYILYDGKYWFAGLTGYGTMSAGHVGISEVPVRLRPQIKALFDNARLPDAY